MRANYHLLYQNAAQRMCKIPVNVQSVPNTSNSLQSSIHLCAKSLGENLQRRRMRLNQALEFGKSLS